MLTSTVAPAEAGDAFVRDNRGWHGGAFVFKMMDFAFKMMDFVFKMMNFAGTPNLDNFLRAIPDAKFHAPNPDGSVGGVQRNSLPYGVWKTMSPHGQHVTRQFLTIHHCLSTQVAGNPSV